MHSDWSIDISDFNDWKNTALWTRDVAIYTRDVAIYIQGMWGFNAIDVAIYKRDVAIASGSF